MSTTERAKLGSDQGRRGDEELAAEGFVHPQVSAAHECQVTSPGPGYARFVIANVTEADFEAKVIERSREVPVVVDFWAEWCGPCRALGPAIEAEVTKRDGQIELAKVDVDANPMLAQAFGIRGIPDVRAFRDAKIVGQFTGALPPAQISAFLDTLLPSEADVLAKAGDEAVAPRSA